MTAVSLLLVEVIVTNRFHRAWLLPYVQGFVRGRMVGTDWVRFGVPASCRLDAAGPGVDFSVEDRRRLVEILTSTRPTHVLFSHPPGGELARLLAVLGERPRYGMLEAGHWQLGAGDECFEAVDATAPALCRFLGLEPHAADPGRLIAVRPDYGWRAGNVATARTQPLPFVVCGQECTYARAFADNPRLAGLDHSGCLRSGGCSFCTRKSPDPTWRPDTVASMRLQLEALVETHPPYPRLAIRMVGERLLDEVEQLAQLARSLSMPGADFLLDARADRLLACRPALERALRSLAGSSHKLHVCLVGIESFVGEELDLFNKGIGWGENLLAAQTLFELEALYPREFGFHAHGGLSLILLTPWTKPEHLALNLAMSGSGGLEGVCGKLLTSRLRLYPGLPLFALAKRDGLLVPAYPDRLLDTAGREFYADETPWRSACAALDAVASLFLRIDEGVGGQGDALAADVEALRREVPAARDRLALAGALVDAVIEAPDRVEPRELLGRARTWLATDDSRVEVPPAAVAERSGPAAPAGDALGPSCSHYLAFEIGAKPVIRLEPGETPDAAWLQRFAPVVEYRRLPGTTARELFIGRDRRQVEVAVRLTTAEEECADETASLATAEELGRLLGYPRCCTRKFASTPNRERRSYTWHSIRLRLAQPGAVPWLPNPASGAWISHLPCSLTCGETLAGAEALVAAARERWGAAAVEESLRSLRNPWAMLVGEREGALELVTDDDPRARFRYRPGRVSGGGYLLRLVAEGDEMVVEEQNLLVLRRGRLHAAVGGRVFLWWHEAAVQPELWRRLADLRFCARRPTAEGEERRWVASLPRPYQADPVTTAGFLAVRGPCDLQCAWCSDHTEQAAGEHDRHDDVRRQIELLHERGASSIGFGSHLEPATHPALPELIDLARQRGFSRIHLSTTGMRLAEAGFAADLARRGLTDVFLTFISFDRELSDLLFGLAGATEAKLAALENCRRLGLRVRLATMFLRPAMASIVADCGRIAGLGADGPHPAVTHGCLMHFVAGMDRKRVDLLWPRLGEVAWAMREIRRRVPDFRLRAADVPLCALRMIPGLEFVAAGDHARGPASRGAQPPELCGGCDLTHECRGLHPDYLALAGPTPLVLTDEQIMAPPPIERSPWLAASPAPEPWQRHIAQRLRPYSTHAPASRRLAGFAISNLAFEEYAVSVHLQASSDSMALFIEPRARAQRCFLAGTRFAVSYRPATPPDTEPRRRAIELLLRCIER
ncbi:MAG: radical SAM protein [Deltaproteobacteria bacterium]|nr:radical SAM protein [Deltaproteobacteria bacterium]